MKRSRFLELLALSPFIPMSMNAKEFIQEANHLSSSEWMPSVFLGHGSPMNALEQNIFTQKWDQLGKSIPKPQAILCISAHWETHGTKVTSMDHPKTIHDFGGFPKALFDVEYPAPGSLWLAHETQEELHHTKVDLDETWGLDHGAWSVLKHVYPMANIPIVQMSLDVNLRPEEHYQLAQALMGLRKKGVLIVGSGNMVHNLGKLNWREPNKTADWALEANDIFKKAILNHDHKALEEYKKLGNAVNLAIPSPEHFLPLLYVLGTQSEKDKLTLFNDETTMGSISMTSVLLE